MGATNDIATNATGKLIDQALKNLIWYISSKPVLIYVIIKVIIKLILKLIRQINKILVYFFGNIVSKYFVFAILA